MPMSATTVLGEEIKMLAALPQRPKNFCLEISGEFHIPSSEPPPLSQAHQISETPSTTFTSVAIEAIPTINFLVAENLFVLIETK